VAHVQGLIVLHLRVKVIDRWFVLEPILRRRSIPRSAGQGAPISLIKAIFLLSTFLEQMTRRRQGWLFNGAGLGSKYGIAFYS
jgi:hypothetical protein